MDILFGSGGHRFLRASRATPELREPADNNRAGVDPDKDPKQDEAVDEEVCDGAAVP